MQYYTTTKISENIAETPEGYLLCYGVPIARLGVQEYAPDEVPSIKPNKDGSVLIYRTKEEVFSERTIASFMGKSVTLLHPESADKKSIDFVTPENWQTLTVGVALNVRKSGAGEEDDLLLADLLIADVNAKKAVKEGLREVSCGYDADIKELGVGVGSQINIIGNHIALVPQGRCGARCSIKDKKEPVMAKLPGFWDKVFKNPKFKRVMDEVAAEANKENLPAKDVEEKSQEPQPATDEGERLSTLESKVDEVMLLLRSLAENKLTNTDEDPATADEGQDPVGEDEVKPTDTEEALEKTGDAKRMRSQVADAEIVRRAKIIAPNISARVGDTACIVKRASLRSALSDKKLQKVIDACLRGTSIDSADCVTLDAAFVAASEVAKINNTQKTTDGLTSASVKDFGKTVTPDDINKANREFHDKKAGK